MKISEDVARQVKNRINVCSKILEIEKKESDLDMYFYIHSSVIDDLIFKLGAIFDYFQENLYQEDISVCDDSLSYTEVDICPERYYFFRFLDKFCEIKRVGKSMEYRIHVNGFIPDWSQLPFDFSKECDYLMKDNYFARSSDFSYVLGIFSDICRHLMEFKQNELF